MIQRGFLRELSKPLCDDVRNYYNKGKKKMIGIKDKTFLSGKQLKLYVSTYTCIHIYLTEHSKKTWKFEEQKRNSFQKKAENWNSQISLSLISTPWKRITYN